MQLSVTIILYCTWLYDQPILLLLTIHYQKLSFMLKSLQAKKKKGQELQVIKPNANVCLIVLN